MPGVVRLCKAGVSNVPGRRNSQNISRFWKRQLAWTGGREQGKCAVRGNKLI